MIIIINGCPSAGKTSTFKEIQNRYDIPLLNLGIDHSWAMIPDQYKEYGLKAQEDYSFFKSKLIMMTSRLFRYKGDHLL